MKFISETVFHPSCSHRQRTAGSDSVSPCPPAGSVGRCLLMLSSLQKNPEVLGGRREQRVHTRIKIALFKINVNENKLTVIGYGHPFVGFRRAVHSVQGDTNGARSDGVMLHGVRILLVAASPPYQYAKTQNNEYLPTHNHTHICQFLPWSHLTFRVSGCLC